MTAPAKLKPRLESGDRMNRVEFHRRYEECPDVLAELIEGVVYVSSPARTKQHGTPHAAVMFWLGTYWSYHRDRVQVADNSSLFLDLDNEPQPDAFIWDVQNQPGLVREDGYADGVPELVVEIAASSVSIDLHDKMRAYRRNGVGEYIVWRTEDNAIDWFELREGDYVRRQPDKGGIIESAQFPGLRLDVAAMLEHDLAKVAAAVR